VSGCLVEGWFLNLTEPRKGAPVKLHRKPALTVLTATALLLTAACGSDNGSGGSGGSDLEGQTLVYANYGGDTLTAADTAWLQPFGEDNGVRTATDSPVDPAKIKAMVDAENVSWDIVDLDTGSGGTGCGTIYEERSPDIDISNIDPAFLSDECGVPIMVQTIGLVYNKDKFGDDPPTKITDFMDTERFPGRRMTLNYAVGGLEFLLLASGVPAESLYPLDYDRAAAAIDELGSDLTLDPSLAEEAAALESGDFSMCLCYFGRAPISERNGAPLGMVWDTVMVAWDALYAVKGSKSPEAQSAFLDYVAQPENQARFSAEVAYGPTTTDTELDVPADFEPWLREYNQDQINNVAMYDAAWWNDNTDAAFAAWTDMTAG
jgi:putative spermidine/putrescine transport system substrate-binding protein